ncbi:rod shape-determining protein RodA [Nevskia soli]|uniref:rod shape-determining protein RodA n=1 Tax=Nevskia soli TaxID=418856 RepID=UPI0004A774D6|nr:rod shape-determining protein RodA [Nevskia soli]
MTVNVSVISSAPKPVGSWGAWFARWHFDLVLGLLLMAVAGLGLFVLYSATGQSLGMVISQAQRLVLGLVVMVVLAQAPPEFYRAAAPWFYGFSMLLLVAVAVLGQHAKGAQRWLDLGVMRFQPSELMKLAAPIAVAAYLQSRHLPPSFGTILVSLALIMVPTGLIAIQPDLGTALLVVTAGVLALFFGGLRWRWIILAVGAVAAAAPLLWLKLHDYQRNRLLTFLDPERDPLGAGYHITQSKIAIGSGGLFGKGWLMGTQAKLDFLPEAHTDFIFAVYSEELGLIGVLLLLLLYTAIVVRCLVISMRGQDTFQRLLAGSLGLTFFIYVFINCGMVIGLVPVVGVPLPLVSYGGTSAVTLLAGFGILMSVQTHRKLLTS